MGRRAEIDVIDMIEQLEIFIDSHDDPLIQRFCVDYGVSRDSFYRYVKDNKRLSDTQKRALDKQEAFIVEQSQLGKYNPVFSIFRLKQPCHGWTDKTETNINLTAEISAISADERKARLVELRQRLLAEGQD